MKMECPSEFKLLRNDTCPLLGISAQKSELQWPIIPEMEREGERERKTALERCIHEDSNL